MVKIEHDDSHDHRQRTHQHHRAEVDAYATRTAMQQASRRLQTLPCNLALIACFLTLMFHKVVWQHVQGVVGFLTTCFLRAVTHI